MEKIIHLIIKISGKYNKKKQATKTFKVVVACSKLNSLNTNFRLQLLRVILCLR